MPIPRREDPLQTLLAFARQRRVDFAQELAVGKWSSEQQARELVGRVKELDALESEMKRLSAPGTQFGETDL